MNKEPKEVDWSKQKPGTIGVMKGGSKVEYICTRNGASLWHSNGAGWLTELENNDVLLPWESCLAEGHNPDGLTNAQVGEGYRLLQAGEQICERTQGLCKGDSKTWFPAYHGYTVESSESVTYRVPITKSKKRIPCGLEHFPPGTVVQEKTDNDELSEWMLVVAWNPYWIRICTRPEPAYFDDKNFMEKIERSTDFGKTWLPCYVETEE